MDFKYSGIILNKKDVGETDRIYTIYTLEAGKVRVLGKGVRRPNAKLAGHLEPITGGEIFIAKTRGLGKITGCIVTDNFSSIKADLDSLSQAFYSFKIVEKLISEQQEDKEIFRLLLNYLQSLDKLNKKEKNKKSILTLGFLFKLLAELGYRLEMEKCVQCGKKLVSGKNYFSAPLGGSVCQSCRENEKSAIKADDASIKFIRIFLKNKIENLSKLKYEEKDGKNIRLILKESLNWILSENSSLDIKG